MGNLEKYDSNPKLTPYLVKNKLITLNVVDIGARDGFSKIWENYLGVLKIIGFDPDEKEEEISKGLCRTRVLSGNGKGRIFYIIRYRASSGLYPPNVEFTNRLQNRTALNIVGTQPVETCTLDSLNLRPDFIKLDVEGSELEILQGGEETLKYTLGVSVEVSFQELFKGAPLFPEIDKFMKEHGFTLYDLDPWRLARYNNNPKQLFCDGSKGQIIIGQALYFRDIYPELDKYSDTEILKMASLFEVFNLEDCAFEILNNHEMKGYLKWLTEVT